MSLLEKLKKNRDSILLAEIGAYLHDLGKATKEFITSDKDPKKKHNYPSIFPMDLQDILKKIEVNICGEKATIIEFIEKHHKKGESGKQKDCEVPKIIRLLYAGWQGYDGIDTGLDKAGGDIEPTGTQDSNNIFIATAFGYEPKENKIEVTDELKTREYLYKDINEALNNQSIVKLRKDIIEKTKKHYQKYLGETRRSANDVTLWDHSYSVATLFKCAIAKNILDSPNPSFDPLDFDWKVFSVNLDVLSLIAKGIKIGDVLGYKEKIDDAFKKVKEFIEEEYPLGNELYRDTSGIYFLIPDVDMSELKELILRCFKCIDPELMPAQNYKFICNTNQEAIPKDTVDKRRDLKNNSIESLKSILPNSKKTALEEIAYPISSERLFSEEFADNSKGKEVCPICRLRLMKEKEDGCKHCLDRRENRAGEWLKSPKQTIWLDEVADHNDRVVLLVGSFGLDNWLDGLFIKTMAIRDNTPKNPSPARIRRCWETTQNFIKDTVFGDVLANFWGKPTNKERIEFKIDLNQQIPIKISSACDIEVEGQRLSPVCIKEIGTTFISTVNLQLLGKWGKTAEEIAKTLNEKTKNGMQIRVKHEKDKVWKEGFTITDVKLPDEKYQKYLPYIQIYDSPDQFIALVPAYDALDVAEKIRKAYETQFSKVRDRLPLHLGVIAFHKRTPLYVVMDAGRRLLEAFKQETKTKDATVMDNSEFVDIQNNIKYQTITIKIDPCKADELNWKISYATGDPSVDDKWHPYLRIKGGNPTYVKELKIGDCIEIEPSFCKFAYLENAADRFRVDEELRPLDDIKRLKELWDKIKGLVVGTSQLYTYWQEVKERRKEYDAETWEHFVKSSIVNILRVSEDKELFGELFQGTKDGLLDLCLSWNLQVRKIKPKEDKNNE